MTDSDVQKHSECKDAQAEVSKVKQRLSAHVQNRMANLCDTPATVDGEHFEEQPNVSLMDAESIKIERDDGQENNDPGATSSQGGPSNAPSPVHQLQQGQSSSGGSFMAGSLMLSNSILDEVLNEKKLALLQSPDVIRFLKEVQKNKANKSK